MPAIPVIMPQLGESIAEATIVSCLVKPGDNVEADQDIIEVETNKANHGRGRAVQGPHRWIQRRTQRKLSGWRRAGTNRGFRQRRSRAVGRLNSLAAAHSSWAALRHAATVTSRWCCRVAANAGPAPTVRGLPFPATAAGAGYMSPRMKDARMNELGLHSADLAGIAAVAPRAGSPLRISKLTSRIWRSTGSRPPRPCVWPWPTRCAAVGRARSPPSACPWCSMPCLAHRTPTETRPGALRVARAGRRTVQQPNAAARLIGGRVIRSESIDIGVAVEAQDGNHGSGHSESPTKTSLVDLTSRYSEVVDLARRRRLTTDMTSGGIASI